MLAIGVLQGLAAGTLLYITFYEVPPSTITALKYQYSTPTSMKILLSVHWTLDIVQWTLSTIQGGFQGNFNPFFNPDSRC